MTQPERTSASGEETVWFEDIEVRNTYWGSELVADEAELIADGRDSIPGRCTPTRTSATRPRSAVSWHQAATRSASTTCQSTQS